MARDDTAEPDRRGGLAGSFRIGSIRGVPVRVHWSVLIIMVLIGAGLGAQALPAAYPGYPAWQYAVAGIAAAAVFLLGLLAHEASHAVVARRNGVGVRDITLWLLGGVAQLEGEARTPGADLRIAGVGPLVSLLIGVLFGALTLLAAAAGAPGLLVGVLSWLAGINVLLAVFNVLPGAPLDGGRLLRAVLWKIRGDRVWASIAAARAGRSLGLLLVVVGLLWFLFFRGGTSGLWLAFTGWFLLGAAGAEERQARVSGALAGVRVRDVMTPSPETAPPGISVAEFIDTHLFGRQHSAFPLVEDGRPVGLVTFDRIRAVPADARRVTSLRDVARPMSDLVVATPDEPLSDLLPRVNVGTNTRALVVDNGTLVGIVSPVDVNRAIERTGALSGRR